MGTITPSFLNRVRLSRYLSLGVIFICLTVLSFAYSKVIDEDNLSSILENVKVVSRLSIVNIESSLAYGTNINELYEAPELIYPIKNAIPFAKRINILSLEGSLLYSTESVADSVETDYKNILSRVDETQMLSKEIFIVTNSKESHYIMPILKANAVASYLDVVILDESVIKELWFHKKSIVLLLLLSMTVFISVLGVFSYDFILTLHHTKNGSPKGIISTIICFNTVLAVLPFIMGVFIFSYMHKSNDSHNNAKSLGYIIKGDINKVVTKGARYTDLGDMNEWFKTIDKDKDIVSNIAIIDNTLNYSSTILETNKNKLYLWLIPDVNNSKAELVITKTYWGLFLLMSKLFFVSIFSFLIFIGAHNYFVANPFFVEKQE